MRDEGLAVEVYGVWGLRSFRSLRSLRVQGSDVSGRVRVGLRS